MFLNPGGVYLLFRLFYHASALTKSYIMLVLLPLEVKIGEMLPKILLGLIYVGGGIPVRVCLEGGVLQLLSL